MTVANPSRNSSALRRLGSGGNTVTGGWGCVVMTRSRQVLPGSGGGGGSAVAVGDGDGGAVTVVGVSGAGAGERSARRGLAAEGCLRIGAAFPRCGHRHRGSPGWLAGGLGTPGESAVGVRRGGGVARAEQGGSTESARELLDLADRVVEAARRQARDDLRALGRPHVVDIEHPAVSCRGIARR